MALKLPDRVQRNRWAFGYLLIAVTINVLFDVYWLIYR